MVLSVSGACSKALLPLCQVASRCSCIVDTCGHRLPVTTRILRPLVERSHREESFDSRAPYFDFGPICVRDAGSVLDLTFSPIVNHNQESIWSTKLSEDENVFREPTVRASRNECTSAWHPFTLLVSKVYRSYCPERFRSRSSIPETAPKPSCRGGPLSQKPAKYRR